MVQRISVIGVSGNGKTTFSKRLAAALGVKYVELDAIAHRGGWYQASAEEMRAAVREIVDTCDGWVIDGSYSRKLGDLVFDRADVVVWLDQPLVLVMTRLVRRALGDIVTRRDLFNGNRQTWRSAFFTKNSLVRYAFKEHFQRRRETPAYFAERPRITLVRLSTPREVDAFVTRLSADEERRRRCSRSPSTRT